MEKIREILRLSKEIKYSIRQIAEETQVSKTSIEEYLAEYRRIGLRYQVVLEMNDIELAEVFEKRNRTDNQIYEALSKEFPYYEKDLAWVGVTLYLLCEEYKELNSDRFSYSSVIGK